MENKCEQCKFMGKKKSSDWLTCVSSCWENEIVTWNPQAWETCFKCDSTEKVEDNKCIPRIVCEIGYSVYRFWKLDVCRLDCKWDTPIKWRTGKLCVKECEDDEIIYTQPEFDLMVPICFKCNKFVSFNRSTCVEEC